MYSATAGQLYALLFPGDLSAIYIAPAITNFDLVGETYDVTVTDPGPPVHAATVHLMVNPNGVIKWGVLPAGTFSQYPLTGTAVTIPVA